MLVSEILCSMGVMINRIFCSINQIVHRDCPSCFKASGMLEWFSFPRTEILMSVPVWLLRISTTISDVVWLWSKLSVKSIDSFFS